MMAAAMDTPISVMETAGEGGAWGIALLAAYLVQKQTDESLKDYLANRVFAGIQALRIEPDAEDVEGFERYMKRFKAAVAVETLAGEIL